MHRAIRPVALMLGFVVATQVPARASSVILQDVAQSIHAQRDAQAALHLRTVTQYTDNLAAKNQPSNGKAASQTQTDTSAQPVTSLTATTAQDGGVQEIQIGDVAGTICDCGEIAIPGGGGGFPRFPLLALAAIPLAFLPFLKGGGDSNSSTSSSSFPIPIGVPTTTPTPTTANPIPEPTTMLLLGSGLAALGAGARRRRRQELNHEAASATTQTTGEEV